jgi:hypothetical protein
MKHVYPPRHPASLDAPVDGQATAPRGNATEPALPRERDESGRDQAAAAPQQRDTGRKAWRDAAGGGADTDRGPVTDQVGSEKAAPHRGPDAPRR